MDARTSGLAVLSCARCGDLKTRLSASEERVQILELGFDRARRLTTALNAKLTEQKETAANAYLRLQAELEEVKREAQPKRRQLFVVNPDAQSPFDDPAAGEAGREPSTSNREWDALRDELDVKSEELFRVRSELARHIRSARGLREDIEGNNRPYLLDQADAHQPEAQGMELQADGVLDCECSVLRVELREKDEELQNVRNDFLRAVGAKQALRAQLQETQRKLAQAVSRHGYELRETQMQAQGASDRLFLANFQSGEVQERLTMAEQALSMYEADNTELQARALSLGDAVRTRDATIAARDAQIRILQFSLDQRVRNALLSSDAPGVDIAGPATMEPWTGLYPHGAPTVSAAPSVWDSGSEHGALDASGSEADAASARADTDDDDARTVLSASSDLGSFSDVSGPPSSFAPGTPRSGSPRPMLSDEDWSELGTDGEGGLSTDEDPFSGASTPARASPPPASGAPASELEVTMADAAAADGRLDVAGNTDPAQHPLDVLHERLNRHLEGETAYVGVWEDEIEGMVLT